MNRKVRELLINHAVNDRPVHYSTIMQQLGLKRGVSEDHAELSKVLAEISKFEDMHKRPMLSAMATYSPETTRMKNGETHGNGFYELAEELRKGKGTVLKRKDFALQEMADAREYWRNKDHYEKFFSIDQDSSESKDDVPEFFNEQDLELLGAWAGKVYEKNNPEHIAAKTLIMNSPGKKTVYWSEQLVKRLPEFETFNWRMWSQKGWTSTPEGKKQVAKFKHYTWARIYKKGDTYKDIFFTVGSNGNHKALVYKIDYYFESNSKLSNSQKELCKQLIPDDVSWLVIPISKFPEYNWKRLIDETEAFIKNNQDLYDEIVRSVWSEQVNVSALRDRLVRRETPENGFDEIPKRNFDFKGAEIDWEKHNKELIEIGRIGEELVIEYEKKLLIDAKKPEYVKEVKKVDDGCGYDIISCHPNGLKKKIEVKSTTRGPETPFPISITEVAFSEQHSAEYTLYRVFNLNTVNKVAEFHEFAGNLKDHFLLESIHFNAFKKSTDKKS